MFVPLASSASTNIARVTSDIVWKNAMHACIWRRPDIAVVNKNDAVLPILKSPLVKDARVVLKGQSSTGKELFSVYSWNK